MILHTKYSILTAFTIVMFWTDVSNSDVEDESDDDKLKQALVLVDILKREYIKAIDDNKALRAKTQMPRAEDLETCPLRMGPDSETSTTPKVSPSQFTGKSKDESTTSYLSGFTAGLAPFQNGMRLPHLPMKHNTNRPLHKHFRRFLPYDYDYYDYVRAPYSINFRRKEGEIKDLRRLENDVFDPNTNITNLTTSSNILNSTEIQTNTSKLPKNSVSNLTHSRNKSSVQHVNLPTDLNLNLDSAKKSANNPLKTPTENTILKLRFKKGYTDQLPNNGSINKNKIIDEFNLRPDDKANAKIKSISLTGHKDVKKNIKDPVQDEVVQELKKELNTITKKDSTDVSMRSASNAKKKWHAFTWKATPRIYLAGSSKVPIPLPENNALCYFSPNNPLCRTFI